MNKGLITLLILILVASGCTTTGIQKEQNVKALETSVTDVVDGDTIDVKMEDTIETVRLLGIDTPEVHVEVSPGDYENVPENDRGKKCLREWGEKASDFANEQLSDKKVNFTTDPKSDTRGSYGRLLGYIMLDGENFNYRMVEKGFARVYTSGFTNQEKFLEAEEEAKNRMRGLWQCQTVEIENITIKDS